MSKTNLLKGVSAIVLAGGLGTRLRPVVSTVPKVLASVGGKPFLDILLSFLKQQRIGKVILAIGYAGEQIKRHCAENPIAGLAFSEETEPLGTGGAFKKALELVESARVFVINGDTLSQVNYADFFEFHLTNASALSLVLTPRLREDSGGVKIGKDNSLLEYRERAAIATHPFMSAGVYLIDKEALSVLPAESAFSLEYDFLPAAVKKLRCYGYLTRGQVIDIGTPERYLEAQDLLV